VFASALNKGIRGGLPLVLGFVFVCALLSVFSTTNIETNNYPNLFYNYFTTKITSKILIVLINYLFILLGVFLVTIITINQEIVDKSNYFPVFIFVVLSSVSINAFQIVPQAFTNIFILFSIYKLLDCYRKENILNQLFEAGFWLSLSAYITISSVISFPLFFIILLILRPFYWREWVVGILGFITPIFILECVSYLSDFYLGYFFGAVAMYLKSFNLPSYSEYYLPLSIFLFLLLLFSLLNNLLNNFSNTVKKQRAKIILVWILIFSSISFFSGGSNSSTTILTFAFPFSYFIGAFLYQLKDIKITNTILVLFILCCALVFLAQYHLI
jgi:hypothetical protein